MKTRTNRTSGLSIRSSALALVGAAGLATSAHAQWTVINLHPTAATSSEARGVFGAQQVGVADTSIGALYWSGSGPSVVRLNPIAGGPAAAYCVTSGEQGGSVTLNSGTVSASTHASRWNGTVSSWIDMHPTDPGVIHSFVYATDGTTQGGSFARGSSGTFSAGQPCLWTGTSESWVDLTPAGYGSGEVHGISGNQQVGATFDSFLGQAGMWFGTPESFVNLNPPEAIGSAASCTDGVHQYGVIGIVDPITGLFPVQWSGTADSWVLLGIDDPVNRWGEVHATHEGWQAGYTTDTDGASNEKACVWTGGPGTFLDINQYLPAGYSYSNALGIWRHVSSGTTYIVGYAVNSTSGQREAVMWVNGTGVNLITSPSAVSDCAAAVGDPIGYGVRVLNAGTVSSGTVTLTVDLPSASVATYLNAVPAPISVTSTQLTFSLGPVAGSGGYTDVQISLTAVGAGATSTISATATTAGETDPTNNGGSASSRIEPEVAAQAAARGVISTNPALANSLIPGGAGRYTTLNHPFASPSGSWWVLNAVTTQATAQNTILVRTATGGPGSIVVQKGITAFPHGTVNSVAVGAEVNDSGVVAFSGTDNGTSSSSRFVATTTGGTPVEAARQGGAIPAIPGVNYNDVNNSANIFASGQVGFAATTTPSGSSSYLANNGASIIARLNVTTPVGAPAPISKMLFNNTGVWALAFDATGSHSVYQADLNTGSVANDQAIVADGALVIQEGVTVLPGCSSPVGPGDIGPGNKFLTMGPDGCWLVRGSSIDATEDWVVRGISTDILQVAKVGDPLFTGAGENWKEDAIVTATFFAQAEDNAGHYVVGGMTDNPDAFANSVLVYDGRRVIARENDPVDLDGNGQFDDGVYIRSFDTDGVAMVAGGVLAVVTLRNADGALCHINDTSMGQALIFIPVCPADFNGDGFLDPLDYNGFINAFEAGDPGADFNNDGFLDPLDYNGYINAFEAGC